MWERGEGSSQVEIREVLIKILKQTKINKGCVEADGTVILYFPLAGNIQQYLGKQGLET